MPNDPFGLPFIYPTKKTAGVTGSGTGFVYFQSSDITDDSHFSGEGHVTNSSGGEFTMSTSGPDAIQLTKNSFSANDIDGCNNSFQDNVDRGYAYKADDPRDIELTIVVKFVDSGSDNGFAIEGPTGAHSSSGCCSGNCYKFDIQYRPNPTKFRFRKEMWHVDNSTDPVTGEFTDSRFNFSLLGRSKWTGFKYIRYNKAGGAKTGHNTPDSVVLEIWANTDVDANKANWFLLKRTEDRGDWGDSGDQCDGDKDQIGVWSNIRFRLKSNDESGEFRFKNVSLREIDPNLTFGDTDPTDTSGGGSDIPSGDPTEVLGSLSLKYDVNDYRTSACAGAGTGTDPGNNPFYHYDPYGTFDGNGGGVVTVADSSPLDLNQFSINIWFRTSFDYTTERQGDTAGQEGMMLVKGNWVGGSDNVNYGMWVSDLNHLRGGFEEGDGTDHMVTSTGTTVNDDKWHMGTITYDNVNVRLYLDGTQLSTASAPHATSATPTTNSVSLFIGKNAAQNPVETQYFIGDLDEIRVWNNDLTSGEISALYSSGTVPQSGAIVYSNTFGGSVAGIGNTKFYKVYTDQGIGSDKELSDTSTWQNRTRIVMKPDNSSSVFTGKKPRQVDIPLKKVGSATGNIYIRIYNSSNSQIYSSAALDASTLTTSYVKHVFDISDNTRVMQVGDRIGVNYGGTSSSNYVVASYEGTTYPNTIYYQYENGSTQEKSRRLTMDVWE